MRGCVLIDKDIPLTYCLLMSLTVRLSVAHSDDNNLTTIDDDHEHPTDTHEHHSIRNAAKENSHSFLMVFGVTVAVLVTICLMFVAYDTEASRDKTLIETNESVSAKPGSTSFSPPEIIPLNVVPVPEFDVEPEESTQSTSTSLQISKVCLVNPSVLIPQAHTQSEANLSPPPPPPRLP